MVQYLRNHPSFSEVCEILHENQEEDLFSSDGRLAANGVETNLASSVLSVLASCLCFSAWMNESRFMPRCVTGYSVGQWVAMYAATMMTFEQLIAIVITRARIMDECVKRRPGAMFAIIGVPIETVETSLSELRDAKHQVYISNYNCYGQYSIAAELECIDLVGESLKRLRPKKLVRLPAAGPWHSPALSEAEADFHVFLDRIPFRPPSIPVVDNVTGQFLPSNIHELKATLARHLSHPVQWERGIVSLIHLGCKEFVEVGFGNTLSKFGFFIDRRVPWRTFAG
jgi:[acyl-carrier-protein] S-malonyltransferase